jgi:hypothetical protein
MLAHAAFTSAIKGDVHITGDVHTPYPLPHCSPCSTSMMGRRWTLIRATSSRPMSSSSSACSSCGRRENSRRKAAALVQQWHSIGAALLQHWHSLGEAKEPLVASWPARLGLSRSLAGVAAAPGLLPGLTARLAFFLAPCGGPNSAAQAGVAAGSLPCRHAVAGLLSSCWCMIDLPSLLLHAHILHRWHIVRLVVERYSARLRRFSFDFIAWLGFVTSACRGSAPMVCWD